MGGKITRASFETLKNTAKNIALSNRGKREKKSFHLDIPAMVGLKLTNYCNLRCKHCYEWSEHGYCNSMEKHEQMAELDINIVKKVLTETSDSCSALYLWGGEPLCYSKLDELASMIESEQRTCVICTNGILVPQKLDSLIKIGKNLEIVIAMEGYPDENDAIRGAGVFKRIQTAINLLQSEREKGNFQGKITIHTVINQQNYSHLFEYAKYVQDMGIDSLVLCFPWYISDESEKQMEDYTQRRLQWLVKPGGTRSWSSFKYGLPHDTLLTIQNELNKIDSYSWMFNIAYYPHIQKCELNSFLQGTSIPIGNKKACNSISLRMDVMPDGTVNTCKHFSELAIGDLHTASVYDVWNSPAYNRFRALVDEELMPVCAQCNNLYLHSE